MEITGTATGIYEQRMIPAIFARWADASEFPQHLLYLPAYY
jgi:hypothetical protein